VAPAQHHAAAAGRHLAVAMLLQDEPPRLLAESLQRIELLFVRHGGDLPLPLSRPSPGRQALGNEASPSLPRARRLARGFIPFALRARGCWSPWGDRNRAPGESSSPGAAAAGRNMRPISSRNRRRRVGIIGAGKRGITSERGVSMRRPLPVLSLL